MNEATNFGALNAFKTRVPVLMFSSEHCGTLSHLFLSLFPRLHAGSADACLCGCKDK